MIIFDEKKHKYINSETGKELISVTTLIGKYKQAFDVIAKQRLAELTGSRRIMLSMQPSAE